MITLTLPYPVSAKAEPVALATRSPAPAPARAHLTGVALRFADVLVLTRERFEIINLPEF